MAEWRNAVPVALRAQVLSCDILAADFAFLTRVTELQPLPCRYCWPRLGVTQGLKPIATTAVNAASGKGGFSGLFARTVPRPLTRGQTLLGWPALAIGLAFPFEWRRRLGLNGQAVTRPPSRRLLRWEEKSNLRTPV